MSLARLHCVGRGHQARFSEDFDQVLAAALTATPNPSRAADEFDDVALLTVPAHCAGDGPYTPSEPAGRQSPSLLEIDEAQPVLRVFRWHWWWAGSPMGRFAFAGRTLNTSRTVVFQARFEPARPTGPAR